MYPPLKNSTTRIAILPMLELGNANANTYLVTSYLMEENALGINDVNVVCVLFTLHCLCRGVVAREYREGQNDP